LSQVSRLEFTDLQFDGDQAAHAPMEEVAQNPTALHSASSQEVIRSGGAPLFA